jgi:hypothetical protein
MTLVEISRNFFATGRKTNDVAYFGEEVDIFNEDGSVTHEGQWRAGQPDENGLAEPGLIMPGTFLLGSGTSRRSRTASRWIGRSTSRWASR